MDKGSYGVGQIGVGFLIGILLPLLILCSVRAEESETKIIGSGNENIGIVSVNQASGNMNNQANVRVFPLDFGPSSIPSSINEIRMERVSELGSNEIHSPGTTKQDLIETSFRNNSGVEGINQSAGSLNRQSNILIMSIGGLISMPEAELDEVSAANIVLEDAGARKDIIRGSFSNSRGIAQVTQSAGSMNTQTNTIVFSFTETHLR